MPDNTVAIQQLIERVNAGDKQACADLIQFAFDRLQRMTKKMKRDFDRLGRWEQTDDVHQNAALRLFEALSDCTISDERHFYRLAALQIRRELIDLCRHYHGPRGVGANHQTVFRDQQASGVSAIGPAYEAAELTADPRRMQEWAEFHQSVGELPEREREIFELLWYHEMPQQEVAELMNMSTRQIKRIWRSAKLHLHDKLQGSVFS